MDDFTRDGDLESDFITDFSEVNNRLNSFLGSSLAQQVPAERLAQAGFYFTGPGDRVRCFSCQGTVENWHRGDTPVDRHKQVSPTCVFLSCVHGINCKPVNGSFYSEEAGDMNYRLRTGEVVDETMYPMAPHMRSEEARLQSFSSWPSNTPVRPQDLAQAGFYYLGMNDRVQCFCCGGMLAGWETGDTAWGEHNKHYPHCFFILGHDVGNIPFQAIPTQQERSGRRQLRNPRVAMGSFEERLQSFAGVEHPISHERLARAGFYCTGQEDRVLCFNCGGGLMGWQPHEEPWEEHAKHYPGCSFLLAEKGQEFVNNIQLQNPQQNASRHQNGFSSDTNGVLQSAMAQKAIDMGLNPCVVEKTIMEMISQTGSNYSSLEALVKDALKNSESSSSKEDEDPMAKLMKLEREKLCKVCMDRDSGIVFIPCGHLATCEECSRSLLKCPICCGAITQKVKTYIS